MSNSKDYTVGWICAITTEYVAAQAFIDEKHDAPGYLPPRNRNDYTLGRIGKHNVVVAVLPMGEYGTSSAARVAEDMMHSFPNIRVGLMVGIGGCAPSPKHDIRLGDIVVSIPSNGQGGVLQYDFGKSIQGQSFCLTGFLDQPPTILRAAVNGLQAEYESEGHQLETEVNRVLKTKPRLRKKYGRPDAASDRLYHSHILHPSDSSSSCDSSCGDDPANLIPRDPRTEDADDPTIHYGLIASANQLMKDALVRDKLAREKDVLCFEMEAAGLMNNFPCLVIRGICDYADSHKNKDWQGYAAMVAAAYAKDLLCRIPPQQVENEARIVDILKPLIDGVAKTTDYVAQITDRIDQNMGLDKLPVARGAEYGSYMDRHEDECLPGTRTELLDHISQWAKSPQGQLIFWLNGMAGTGKSTLSRTVAQWFKNESLLGASFFFKRGEEDRGNAMKLFPTLAEQLVRRVPELIPAIREAIREDPKIGEKRLMDQFDKLLLQPLLGLNPPTHPIPPVVIVIDALDECEGDKEIRLILYLLPRLQASKAIHLRVFLTSRPELPIRLGFLDINHHDYHDLALHEISEKVTEHDIRLVLKDRFKKVRHDRRISMDWPSDDVIQKLVTIAVPLFISAATMCRYIENSKWDPIRRLTGLLQDQSKYATKMDKTYMPILTRLLDDQGLNKTEQQQLMHEFQETVGVIILLAVPLSINTLSRFIGNEADIVSNRLDSFQSVLSISHNRDQPVRILHQSFRDFLLETDSIFCVDKRTKHREIAAHCLKTMCGLLKRDICNLQSYGTLRTDIDSQTIHHHLPPQLQYSCRYWVYHVTQSRDPHAEMDDVFPFLREHFLHWVEAMSLLGLVSEVVGMLNLLQTVISDDRYSEMSDFLGDAKRFILKSRQITDDAPLQLYCSGLIFAPRTAKIRRQFETEFPTWISQLPQVREDWSVELQTLEGHSDLVKSVAFSSDGRQLASGSADKTVRLWDTATGTLQLTLEGHSDKVTSVAFSPNGRLLASGSDDKTVRLWDTTTGAFQQTLGNHSHYVESVDISPDDRLLASVSYTSDVVWSYGFTDLPAPYTYESGYIRLWDVTTGTLQHTLEGDVGKIRSVAFSSDGRLLASGSEDTTVRLWDTATGVLNQTLKGHSGYVISVALSPDGRLLASGSVDQTVRLWDIATSVLQQTLGGDLGIVHSVAFSPDGRLLASGSVDQTVRLWDIATGSLQQTLKGHSNDVYSVAFSPDGQLLGSGSGDSTVRVWDLVIGPLQETPKGHSRLVLSVAFSPDGRLLASGSDDGNIRIWDTATGAVQMTMEGQQSPVYGGSVYSVAFSPDGRLLASGSSTVQLWDTATGTLQQTLKGHPSSLLSVVFSPDGRLLASSSRDTTVLIWDAVTGALQQSLNPIRYSSWIKSLAFSPDSRLLASGSSSNIVRLWDTTTGALQQTPGGQSESLHPINSVVFSPDGLLLASGSDDKTVRLWDSITGILQHTWNLAEPITNLEFLQDGPYLRTNLGFLNIQCKRDSHTSNSLPVNLDIGIEKDLWIKLSGERVLWLPSESRPSCSVIKGSLLALGHASGRVSFLGFRL